MSMLVAILLTLPLAGAEEGMWLPEQLPALGEELASLGLEVPAESLTDPLGDPLGAVVSLGGCSASFVSPDGLAITNHHCVEGYLRYVSDAEHDRGTTGILAPSREAEEWAGPTARMWVVERITDVTGQIEEATKRLRGPRKDVARALAVEAERKKIIAECEVHPDHRCDVASFYGGREYRLLSALEIQDVRLVYAPPLSVGSYGGDIDNWMWPRHGGDFGVIRAYVAPDGASAPHAEENVPYRPAHHLRIQPAGVNPGDFVMVAGYPGSTDRYRLATEFRHEVEARFPEHLRLFEHVLTVLRDHTARDPEAAARLSAPIGWVENNKKYLEGILDNLEGVDLIAHKTTIERDLDAWIAADPKRSDRLGPALVELHERIEARQATWRRDTVVEGLFFVSDLFGVGHTAYRFAIERQKPDLERDEGYQDRNLEDSQAWLEELDQTLVLGSERDLLALVIEEAAALPEDQRIPPLDAWVVAQGGAEAAIERLFDDPSLASTEGRLALLEADRATLEASDDPWMTLAVQLEPWLAARREEDRAHTGAMLRLRPPFMEALLASHSGPVYPDANSTLRITYGTVCGMSPRDGIWYQPQTTVAGMAAKAGSFPFDAPPSLLERVPEAPASRWADPGLGDVPVNFLTSLDTTGGNSGSAVLNGRGELVGLAFDGNYESMSADWVFQPDLTRTIALDIRYVGWVLDGEP
ncbi:MAG: S46 family peptidase, partial [Deltaproteobacteria bacterium]|nr:S46 family peptidase [Deltaproteobacteria bacterium]